MRITVIGTGYVGLITGVCLAYKGHTINCYDINKPVTLNDQYTKNITADIIIPKISYKVYADEVDYDIMNKEDISVE